MDGREADDSDLGLRLFSLDIRERDVVSVWSTKGAHRHLPGVGPGGVAETTQTRPKNPE